MRIDKFYNQIGWKNKDQISKDAELFEDLRDCAKNYISKCRKRILRYIPDKGKHILDFASGPIQYKEYLTYSKNFQTRHCVDFSKDAIREAKKKLKHKGKYYCNDFFKIKFKENFFDCIICIHTLYHIHKNKQKKVVENLLKISKKDSPIIIIYSNPNTVINFLKKKIKTKTKKQLIYFFCHPNKWWFRFNNIAHVKIFPWRSFASQHQKLIFPNNILGKIMFKMLFFFEDTFPDFFAKNLQYQVIVLRKK